MPKHYKEEQQKALQKLQMKQAVKKVKKKKSEKEPYGIRRIERTNSATLRKETDYVMRERGLNPRQATSEQYNSALKEATERTRSIRKGRKDRMKRRIKQEEEYYKK